VKSNSLGRPGDVDAVVIGAVHSGLVAAATRGDAGWDVLVLEAEPRGAVRSAELVPGYVTDLYSALYSSVARRVIRALRPEDTDRAGHTLRRWSLMRAARTTTTRR
jgi:phytoene dehydrogenase-like protein